MKIIQCTHSPHHHNGFEVICRLWKAGCGAQGYTYIHIYSTYIYIAYMYFEQLEREITIKKKKQVPWLGSIYWSFMMDILFNLIIRASNHIWRQIILVGILPIGHYVAVQECFWKIKISEQNHVRNNIN